MDPYSILGVPKNCDRETLRQKYKKLALVSHPDRGGSEALFKLIKISYQKIHEEIKLRQIDKQFNDLKMGFVDHKQNIEKPHKNKYMPSPVSPRKSPENGGKAPSNDFITQFNRVFEDHKLKNPEDNGYAHMMDQSSSKRQDIDIKNTMGKFNIDHFNTSFNSISLSNNHQVAIYREPEPTSLAKNLDYYELGVDRILDFSGKNETSSHALRYMDYHRAHTTNRLVDPTKVKRRAEYRSMQHLEKQRNNVDFQMTDHERIEHLKHLKKMEQEEQKRTKFLQNQDSAIFDNYNRVHDLMIDYRT
jgi:curved DNA-binding protein CbpA